MIVAPHPDDETIGAAAWMARHADFSTTVLHITDGSPRDISAARAKGFRSRRAYAVARRRELRQALSLLAPGFRRLRVLGIVDGECHRCLPRIIDRLTALIEDVRPAVVISPTYEGGHPDHDSAALAVAVSRGRASRSFRHLEYPLYHSSPRGKFMTGRFLSDGEKKTEIIRLSGHEQDMKRRMMACFTSQQSILKEFRLLTECFREAPSYDFTRPPHPGLLLYERWQMGVSGEEWRRRAAEALGHGKSD
jgi:LmbE family N-acetylglucosaminyl deacetylase